MSSAADTVQMTTLIVELESLCSEVSQFSALLDDEFDAMKAQDLARLEALQPIKERALAQLGDARFRRVQAQLSAGEAAGLPVAVTEKWARLVETAETIKASLARNEVLISRKLTVVRDALQTLYQTGSREGVQLYDRLGRLTRPGRSS